MKKILYVTTISGFLPQFEKHDVEIMQEMGYEIHYASNFNNPIYTFDRQQLKKQGIILHQIDIQKSPKKIRQNGRAIRQLKAIIDQERINMIHCHNPMGGVAARIAARVSKMHPYVIYTAHGFHFYKGAPLVNWLCFYTAERILARQTDMIITINKEDYCRAKEFRLKKGGIVRLIHGVGVDMDRFQRRSGIGDQKREEMRIPKGALHIVTAAELNENKNQKVIIDAIARTGKKDIYYSICGKGPCEVQLSRLIRDRHLEEQVRLLGYCTDMEEILQTADVFAFPSIREGLGIAAVEALATGVPLIVADNRGTREYARDGVNALVCKADSVEEFEAAILRMYEDVKYRTKLTERCRELAKKFSIQETAARMKKIYKEADEKISSVASK